MNSMVLNSPVMVRAHVPSVRRRARLLTRRGWAVVALVIILALGTAYLAGAGRSTGAVYLPTDSMVVHQGDTLWSIAAELTPKGGDVRQTIALIKSLNQLEGVGLVAGDQLWVPQLAAP